MFVFFRGVPLISGTAQYSSFDYVHNALTQTFLSMQLVHYKCCEWWRVPTLQKLLLESIQDTQFNFDLRMQKSYLHITK